MNKICNKKVDIHHSLANKYSVNLVEIQKKLHAPKTRSDQRKLVIFQLRQVFSVDGCLLGLSSAIVSSSCIPIGKQVLHR